MKSLMFCYGTRPEIIKLAPVIAEASSEFEIVTVFTSQHGSLYEDVRDLVPPPNYIFPENSGSGRTLTDLMSDLIGPMGKIIEQQDPDLVIVQGDTASAYMASVAAFHKHVKVGHVEAGLRTRDLSSPFPEEFYRQSISRIASYNWCPTTRAAQNLCGECIHGHTIVTGNTIVDMVMSQDLEIKQTNEIVITLHRRENADKFEAILQSINNISDCYEDLTFTFPAHPNPIIQKHLDVLSPSINVVPPMGYPDFLRALARCRFIITDSGGLQEEACCLRKKALVCRNTTERPEAVEAGFSMLVDTNPFLGVDWALEPVREDAANPYGDGHASERIIDSLGGVS